jgi:hypothetical protein
MRMSALSEVGSLPSANAWAARRDARLNARETKPESGRRK